VWINLSTSPQEFLSITFWYKLTQIIHPAVFKFWQLKFILWQTNQFHWNKNDPTPVTQRGRQHAKVGCVKRRARVRAHASPLCDARGRVKRIITRPRTRISAVTRATTWTLKRASEQLSGYRGDFRKPNKTLKKGLRQHNDLHPSPTNWTNRIIHLLLTSHWTFTPHSNFACPNLLKNPGVATILTIPSST
jgi:hypothetical protein